MQSRALAPCTRGSSGLDRAAMAGPCSGLSPWARAPASGLVQRSSRPWRRSDSVLVTASSQSDTPRFPSHPPPQPHLQQPTVAHRAASISAAAVLALGGMLELAPPADAVLVSPNAAIARSADAALRRSIPAVNRNVKVIQDRLEEVQYLLRIPQRKPYGTMSSDVDEALALFQTREALLDGAPLQTRAKAEAALDELYASLQRLQVSIKTQQPDYVALRVSEALKATAELEVIEAPGLTFSIPKDYQGLPRLVGRAVVQFEVQRRDGAPQAFVDSLRGGLSNTAKIQVTLDGYSAPLSAGNFVKRVLDGQYDGRVLDASSTAVVVPSPPGSQVGAPIPLEILPLGEFEPIYRLPLDVQGGELPMLPLSIPGAVSMTHVEGDSAYLSSDAWFVFKFDKQQAGLSGLAFDEGAFGVMGYVTEGMDVVGQLRSGDTIVRATVLSGADKLVLPAPAKVAALAAGAPGRST